MSCAICLEDYLVRDAAMDYIPFQLASKSPEYENEEHSSSEDVGCWSMFYPGRRSQRRQSPNQQSLLPNNYLLNRNRVSNAETLQKFTHNHEKKSKFDGEQILATKCGHVFHKTCIFEWYQSTPYRDCPSCRTRINPRNFVKLYLESTPVFRHDSSSGTLVTMTKNQFQVLNECKSIHEKELEKVKMEFAEMNTNLAKKAEDKIKELEDKNTETLIRCLKLEDEIKNKQKELEQLQVNHQEGINRLLKSIIIESTKRISDCCRDSFLGKEIIMTREGYSISELKVPKSSKIDQNSKESSSTASSVKVSCLRNIQDDRWMLELPDKNNKVCLMIYLTDEDFHQQDNTPSSENFSTVPDNDIITTKSYNSNLK